MSGVELDHNLERQSYRQALEDVSKVGCVLSCPFFAAVVRSKRGE